MHFTPTGASWLNMFERCSGASRKRIRRESFTSMPELEMASDLYVARHKLKTRPFIWTTSDSGIAAMVTRAKAALAAAS
jgi:hypothetical protein